MQVFMNGQESFDVEFYNELATCLNQLGPRVLESVGAQWDGMIHFAQTGGNPESGDTWLPCEARKWFEYNCTTQEYGNMPIFEPCNYASNVAYYHTATEICARKVWNMPQRHGILNFISTFLKDFSMQISSKCHGNDFRHSGSRLSILARQ